MEGLAFICCSDTTLPAPCFCGELSGPTTAATAAPPLPVGGKLGTQSSSPGFPACGFLGEGACTCDLRFAGGYRAPPGDLHSFRETISARDMSAGSPRSAVGAASPWRCGPPPAAPGGRFLILFLLSAFDGGASPPGAGGQGPPDGALPAEGESQAAESTSAVPVHHHAIFGPGAAGAPGDASGAGETVPASKLSRKMSTGRARWRAVDR